MQETWYVYWINFGLGCIIIFSLPWLEHKCDYSNIKKLDHNFYIIDEAWAIFKLFDHVRNIVCVLDKP